MKWKWKIKKVGRNFQVKDKKDEFILTAYFLKQLYPLFKAEADKSEIDEAIWLILKTRLFYFLSYRDRSQKEIKQYLERLNLGEFYPKAQSWLKKLNLIDDRKFAQKLIDYKKESGFGPYYIKQQLWQKGINPDLIEAILKKSYTEKEEKRIAQEVFKKYNRKLKSSEAKELNRLMRYLAGRGFSQHIIYQLINKNNSARKNLNDLDGQGENYDN
jgi:SOS response regulatory protein OraA/RecX